MGSMSMKEHKDGTESYRVQCRRTGLSSISKTFEIPDDALRFLKLEKAFISSCKSCLLDDEAYVKEIEYNYRNIKIR